MFFITGVCSAEDYTLSSTSSMKRSAEVLGRLGRCTWQHELAVVIVVKPPGAVLESLGAWRNTKKTGSMA